MRLGWLKISELALSLVEQGTNSWSANGTGSLFVSPDFIQYISQEASWRW